MDKNKPVVFLIQTPIEVYDIVAHCQKMKIDDAVAIVVGSKEIEIFLSSLNIFKKVLRVDAIKMNIKNIARFSNGGVVKNSNMPLNEIESAGCIYYSSSIRDFTTFILVHYAFKKTNCKVVKLESPMDALPKLAKKYIPIFKYLPARISGIFVCWGLQVLYQCRWRFYVRCDKVFPYFSIQHMETSFKASGMLAKVEKRTISTDGQILLVLSNMENNNLGLNKIELQIAVLEEISKYFKIDVVPHPRSYGHDALRENRLENVNILKQYIPVSFLDCTQYLAVIGFDSAALKEANSFYVYSLLRDLDYLFKFENNFMCEYLNGGENKINYIDKSCLTDLMRQLKKA